MCVWGGVLEPPPQLQQNPEPVLFLSVCSVSTKVSGEYSGMNMVLAIEEFGRNSQFKESLFSLGLSFLICPRLFCQVVLPLALPFPSPPKAPLQAEDGRGPMEEGEFVQTGGMTGTSDWLIRPILFPGCHSSHFLELSVMKLITLFSNNPCN